ncbi:hypothetical protein HHL19_32350 [Streptomyces sp. R302]|uniref:hypothetical protein n=1 Tax=unclassified Streptomyces TaxID=2593676 RepID=UPI00145E7E6C|nr:MULTISPECIES: hypothetical protein [unclassified Streptomyces]NML53951.1 hypothetical protein [Streptomyces sp. R301]NML83211.1 hypothetical protein [Streptomyces sp. R302]
MSPHDLPPARSLPAMRKEQLRAALVREAEATPRGVPRARRAPSRRLRLGIAAGTVAAGVCAWTAIGLLAGSDSAYASWTAVPDAVRLSDTTSLAASCEQRLPDGSMGPVGTGKLSPVLAERRGEITAVMLGNDNSAGVCLDGTDSLMAGRSEVPGLSGGEKLSVAGNGGKTNGEDAARYVYGRVSSDVVKVTVGTSDGRHVTATTANGYFFAWWPSGADPVEAEAFNSAGVTVTSVNTSRVPHS